jgi:hypothetical protein
LHEEDEEGKFGMQKRNWYSRQTEFSSDNKVTNGTLVDWGNNFKLKKYQFSRWKRDAVGTFLSTKPFHFTQDKHQ